MQPTYSKANRGGLRNLQSKLAKIQQYSLLHITQD